MARKGSIRPAAARTTRAKKPARSKTGASLDRLDIGMLASLNALLAERSVTRAARRLGLAQPTMSNALARLRAAFGDPLIVRSGKEMVLTRRAESMRERVETVHQEIEALSLQVGFDPCTSAASFHLAVTDYASLLLMPGIMAEVLREAPNVRLMTASLTRYPHAADQADAPEAHLRMHWAREAPPDWHSRHLLDEDMVIIGRRRHPDLLTPLTMERFLQLRFATVSPRGPGFETHIDVVLKRHNLKRCVIMSLAHFTTLPFVIGQSDLVAMFPRRLLRLFRGSLEIEVAESPFSFEPFSTSLVWHPRFHHDDAHRWLRQLIVRVATRVDEGVQAVITQVNVPH